MAAAAAQDVDFLVGDAHVADIAIIVNNTPLMKVEWVRIMKLLLARIDDAAARDEIGDLLKESKVFEAADLTLTKWIGQAGKQAWFSSLLRTIEKVNPTLKSKLNDARMEIQGIASTTTGESSASIIASNNASGDGSTSIITSNNANGDKLDFAVEENHSHFIAMVATKHANLENDWKPIMNSLLKNSMDQPYKSAICKKLKNDDVYSAVCDTIIKWRSQESENAKFNDLLLAIGRMNPDLRNMLDKAREDIRNKKE